MKQSSKNPISFLLGKKVRPKKILAGLPVAKKGVRGEKRLDKDIREAIEDCTTYDLMEMCFNMGFYNVFEDMKIGNLYNSPKNSYYGVVNTVVTREIDNLKKLQKIKGLEEALEFEEYYKKNKIKYYVDNVHIDFFKGTTEEPARVSIFSSEDNKITLSYTPWQLYDLDKLIKFDSLKQGDVIKTPKSQGIVVRVKELNKPNFWRTNSLVSRNVEVLFSDKNGQRIKKISHKNSFELLTSA